MLIQYIWLNLWNHTFHYVLCVPGHHHFSRYLPPEQRCIVTAVSTRLRQLCGTTSHSSSKLWTRYQFLNRVYKQIFFNKLFVCKYSIWHRLFWTFICICRLLLMIVWYLHYLDPLTFFFTDSFWITSPNSFRLQCPFTISVPTIILWYSYSVLSLVSLLPTPPPLVCLTLLIGILLQSHHPLFHFYIYRLLSTAFKIIII